LRIPYRSITGLIGPNGSGKSTLFDIITGFQHADSGTVSFQGQRINQLAPYQIAQRGLMRTFQLPEGGHRLTTIEHLLVAATNQQEQNLLRTALRIRQMLRSERENLAKAQQILQLLQLERVANEYVGNLSGGQRKLVDIGRMLMASPVLCLLDEPTAGVNPTLINDILDALKRMHYQLGISVFIIEHNMSVISAICEYVFVLDAGQLIAAGPPEAIQADEKVLRSYLRGSRPVPIQRSERR
jgi:ABC-type branched-subunit amino acid transport system ATPase component